jgi:hypothetical protein
MGNYQDYQVPSDQTAEERDLIRRQYERETGRFNRPSAPTVTMGGRVTEYIAGHEDGSRDASARTSKVQTAYVNPGLRPGHIMIGGVETTIEAAKAAGIDVGPFDRAASSLSDADEAAAQRDRTRAQSKPQWGIVVEGSQQPGEAPQVSVGNAPQGDTDEDQKAAHGTPEAAVEAASKAIQGIEQLHGSHVVDAGLEAVVDSGELPEELPEGVTPGHIERVVAGYVASANSTLSGVGSSVKMLMETLPDDDLREARRASVMGDAVKLQHLGARAVDALASMPTADPEAFAEMLEEMPAEERAALSQAANGDWLVTLPGRAPMGFGAAVRAGIVSV